MTAPSPDAAQPPVPHQPMPCLGRGVHWPDIMAKIEAERRDKPAPAGALDHARRQLGIEDAAKEAAQFADEALELAELALPAANEALAAVGGESGNAPSTPSLGETGSSLGVPFEAAAPFLASILGLEQPSSGPPYAHRYVPPDEDEPPAPSYTFSRRARWRRALDRMRRSQP